jgi:hypothetical protein
MSSFAFSPSTIYFKDVEMNKKYCEALTITNKEFSPQKVKLITPKSSLFSLSDLVEFKTLAPGMSCNVNVFFESNDPINNTLEDKILLFQDNVTVNSKGPPLLKEIPIIVTIPSADIRYDSEVDFGEVFLGTAVVVYITFSNHGKKQGLMSITAFLLLFLVVIAVILKIFLFFFCLTYLYNIISNIHVYNPEQQVIS